MTDLAALGNLLATYFSDEHMKDGVAALKRDLPRSPQLKDTWTALATAVRKRTLASGEALKLVLEHANRSLEEDTDEEALRFLGLVVRNVERTDGKIDEY